jgi:hypothetical protein
MAETSPVSGALFLPINFNSLANYLTDSNVPAAMWNLVESNLGLVAANAPCLRPLVKKWISKGGETTTQNSYGASHPTGFARMDDYKTGTKSHVTALSRHDQRSEDDLELLERGNGSKGGINVRTDVDVELNVHKYVKS